MIPLDPEFITPQDGHAKQDGESAAAQRWLLRKGNDLAAHNITILGDDLYSHQPHCSAIKAQNMTLFWSVKKSRTPRYTNGWMILIGSENSVP